MAIDMSDRLSRRGLLAAAAAGTAAAVAGVATRVERVLAAGDDGSPVVVGGKYDDVRSTTRFANSTNDDPLMRFVGDAPAGVARSLTIHGDGALRASYGTTYSSGSVVIDGLGIKARGGGAGHSQGRRPDDPGTR